MIYTHRDVVCGIFSQGLCDHLGFKGEGLRRIIQFAQTATEEQLANAWILVARLPNGLLRPVFVGDRRLDPEPVCKILEIEGDFANADELVGALKEAGRYRDHSSVLETLSQISRGMDATEEKQQIGEAALNSGNEAC